MSRKSKNYPVTSYEQLSRAINFSKKHQVIGKCVFAASNIRDDGGESGGRATGTFHEVQGADGAPITCFRIDKDPLAFKRQVIVTSSEKFFAEASIVVRLSLILLGRRI